jgi:hypothetical protein
VTKEEIDTMLQQAMRQSIEEGEMFTRYHFAKLVAEKEREACAKLADEYATWGGSNFYDWFKKLAAAIRARGEQA